MAGEARCAVGVPNVGAFGDPLLLVELAVAAEEHGRDGFFSWAGGAAARRTRWPASARGRRHSPATSLDAAEQQEAAPLSLDDYSADRPGGLALWLLRLALAPASMLTGFRAWALEQCPVAPGRRPPRTALPSSTNRTSGCETAGPATSP